MLDIAKLESGRYEFHVENTDISKILHELADDAEQLSRQKNLTFIRDIDIPDSEAVLDVGKTKQIFTNLL